MNMDSFDMILTIAALVMGVMLLTGHGDVLMKGGNAAERKKLYDDKKVQLVSGVTLLIFWNSHRSGYGDQELCIRYHLSGSSNCYLHYHGGSDSQEM